MTNQEQEIRIYFASLADYNAGRLVGCWVDVDEFTDVDELQEAIDEMLAGSKEMVAEEWAIHDFELPYGLRLSEYCSLDDVIKLAHAALTYGEAFSAHLLNHGTDYIDGVIHDFEEYGYTVFADKESAGRFDLLGDETAEAPDRLDYFIDWDHVYREMRHGYNNMYELDDGSIAIVWAP
jgi:antirestriction protein